MKSPDDASFQQWNEDPEPRFPNADITAKFERQPDSHDMVLHLYCEESEIRERVAYDGPVIELRP